MKDLQALRLYTRVARLGSFSAAARECGLSQSQASRIIAELEASLGARLLSRTTRAVVSTEAGSEFLARVEPLLVALQEAESSVREDGALRGLLRVGMPTSFGVRVLLPRLARFTEQHPALHVQIMLEDKMQDLVREAVDVGIRVGAVPDAVGTAKLLAKVRRVVVAAPAYLQRAGTPRRPADLRAHRIVGGPASLRPPAWHFQRGEEKTSVALTPHVTVNDTAGAVAAATGGIGIVSTTFWACQSELESGALVRLLTAWKSPEIPVHAYFPLGHSTRRAARAFVEFLGAEVREHAR